MPGNKPGNTPGTQSERNADRSTSGRQPSSTATRSRAPSSKSSWLAVVAAVALATVFVFWSGWPTPGEGTANASGSNVQVATGVCDAHRLKALKANDPSIEIEIPAEFDKPFPSASACQSAVDAWDPKAPGPKQPIPFSHKHHAGQFKIECLYCHAGTDKSSAAGVPSVELCMGCHSQFPTEYDEIEGIRILKQHWEEKKPIEWVQIHRLPEHVQFRHNRHVQAGVACQTCHGPVEQIDKLHLVPDTKMGYLVPVAKLEMGWCISCHRQNHQQASQDCLKCHY